jgi:hypothetical protein
MRTDGAGRADAADDAGTVCNCYFDGEEMMDTQDMERAIVGRFAQTVVDAGLKISVDNGEYISLDKSDDVEAIVADLMACDMDWLHVFDGQKRVGTLLLVYGNGGYDVICDYSVSLEAYVKDADRLAEELEMRFA